MKHLGDSEWMGFFSVPEDPDREVPGQVPGGGVALGPSV